MIILTCIKLLPLLHQSHCSPKIKCRFTVQCCSVIQHGNISVRFTVQSNAIQITNSKHNYRWSHSVGTPPVFVASKSQTKQRNYFIRQYPPLCQPNEQTDVQIFISLPTQNSTSSEVTLTSVSEFYVHRIFHSVVLMVIVEIVDKRRADLGECRTF